MAAKKQEQDPLAEKLKRLGYPSFEVMPGEEDVLMLHVEGHLIGGAGYALALSDDALKALIDETLEVD
jgi:hypothetical protein